MKRICIFLLCLAMMLSVTACKPDNITYPTEVIDPNQQAQEETPSQETSASDGQDAPEEQETETPAEDENAEEEGSAEQETEEAAESSGETEEPEDAAEAGATANGEAEEDTEEVPDEGAETEGTEAISEAEESTESAAEEIPVTNPLADESFTPSTEVTGALQASGMIKPGAAVSALKNRTITLYTADSQPAFSYTDKNGKTVREQDWMEKLAAENGFLLKYQIKNQSVSLKSQRVALFAGQKLSLVQMAAAELGNGMTLAASAADLLDTAIQTFGISMAVLEQSDYKLFAPVGNAESLWYDAAAMPEGTDPYALSKENQWTVEQFKTVCAGVQDVQRLEMQSLLPWATLSGKSPLTLLDGKLDSNINAGVTREVWTELKSLDMAALMTSANNAEEEAGTVPLFTYTDTPAIAEGQTLQYAPLPSLKEGESGTVTFTGTFFALPKYEEDTDALRAALTFAELWCNRYTEVRAAQLQALGIKGADYQAYCDLAESQGMLVLYTPEIQKAAEAYLSGLTDPTVDMNDAYEEARSTIDGLIAARNLYYQE